MRLTRIIVSPSRGQLVIKGDFAGATGKRVRLALGKLPPGGSMADVIRAGLDRVEKRKKSGGIGGM
jgi:hypothetical protein